MARAVDSVWGYDHNVVVTDQAQYLTDDEISRFLDELDHNGDGLIDYDEVEEQLDAVHDEIIPQPREHNFLARKKTMLLRRLTRHSHAHPASPNPNANTHANLMVDELGPNDGGNLTATTTRTTTTVTGGAGLGEGISRTHSVNTSRGGGGGIRRSISSAASRLGALSRPHSTAAARGGAGTANHSQPHHRSPAHNLRHEFLRSIIGSDAQQIPRAEFANRVKQWKIPSLELSERQSNRDYVRKMSVYRRVRAYWAVHGPEIAFLMLVISLQLAFGIWQLIKYTTGSQYRNAFGWGVGMAKAFAGALYPTMFFLIISMSRYASTFLRRSYYVSRFINWDLSQSFHIKIACVALILGTLHAVGHLTGTFNVGSKEDREDEVAAVLGAEDVPIPYSHYIVSLPGLTGITALSLFYLLALLSMPQVRRWNYEVFQLGHLLMYPIIGLLFAHGTSGFLQWPMLGYWMALPTLLILVERAVRIGVGFHNLTATVRILDGETVEVTVMIPSGRFWVYKPGQYVFFQVPKISRFQWHPFTVSVCVGKKMQLHIKTDGNWTRKLRELADESGEPTEITVGINGPFGAPAQRFYEFNHAIVVGSGIGVTPFSGILSDLQAKDDALHGGPGHTDKVHTDWNGFSSTESERLAPVAENEKAPDEMAPDEKVPDQVGPLGEKTEGENVDKDKAKKSKPTKKEKENPDYRRVDFHWTVRERNYLLWMSELLNSVFLSQQWHRQQKLKEQQQSIPHIDNNPQAQLGLPLSNIARQNSYIPPLNLPSTPAHRPSPTPDAQCQGQSRCQPQRLAAEELEDFDTLPHLDIRIYTHVTGILSKSRSIATHVYAWLLEMHRTVTHPASPLTGLLNPTQFGRPDFVTILDSHYEDMVRLRARESRRREAERERKDRERERRAREKERRTREKRDREKEAKKDRKERGSGYGHSYTKSTNSISSFRSGFTNRYYGGGNASARASAISFGGGVGGGNSGARMSAISFGGGGGGDRNSNSNLTLSSTGRVDSLYVYSSANGTVSRNPSSAGGGGHSEVESPPVTEKTVTGGGSGSSGGRGDDILRVGVFYCGTPAVGSILADRCRALTARGHADGTGIEYHFMTEVFG